ncbi:MAG TPA: PQQ-binding-like beta-propeller repeat protein, partial [Planctomycetota bacterium]|nr:PQQ-binding-like beta-propeller repeat protein [Planctomycetota bacterium]
MSAFDLATGRLRWKTLVCSSQTEVNMFGNRNSEFASAPLCYEGGCLFGATNLGLNFSARADDGSLRWIRSYPIIQIPQSRMRARQRNLPWANNPPVVVDGKVILTPNDSPSALCLDAETGRLVWSLSHEYRDPTRSSTYPFDLRWFLGVVDGQAWFSGQAVVRVAIETGQSQLVASPPVLGMPNPDDVRNLPQPLLTRDLICFSSVSGGFVVLDLDGRLVDAPQLRSPHIELGNLIAEGGILVSGGPLSVSAYYDIDALLTRARVTMEAAPDDLGAALVYAELLAARPHPSVTQLEAAVSRFDELLERCEAADQGAVSAVALRARAGLYHKLRQLALVVRSLGRSDEALRHQSRALELAHDLWRANVLEESDVIRLTIALHDDAASDDATRRTMLERLERLHGASDFAFGGGLPAKVGLFVLMQRYAGLEASDASGEGRVAILRRMLVEHGSARLPASSGDDATGRNFAIRELTQLKARLGKAVYAPYEAEASKLLADAAKDAGKLQVVLEQYPTSEAAGSAL